MRPLVFSLAFAALSCCVEAQLITQTFNFTGSAQTFIVPVGVTSLTVDMQGAQGGTGFPAVSTGGNGGRLQGTLTVTPGQVLEIRVGGAGGHATSSTPGAAGYNGGGVGGFHPGPYGGGGGGGASDIRVPPYSLSGRIAIAGGGGGGAFNYGTANYDRGGAGGGATGATGYSGNIQGGQGSGTGGSQVAAGIGGAYSGYCTASNGGIGVGGAAGSCTNSGGGGGGGYYGGGGGTWSGGGGGSSFLAGAVHTQGYQTGNGSVTIGYVAFSSIACSITGSFCAGATVDLPYTATGSYAPGNTFTAQISDASGFFPPIPTVIGSVSATASGSIFCTIDPGTLAGTAYRIRVVSSDPVVTGSDNGSDITISTSPSATIAYLSAAYQNCSSVNVSRTGTAGGTYSSTPGLTIDPISGSVNAATSTLGTYTVTYTIAAAGGCAEFQTTTSITVLSTAVSINYAGSPYCTTGGTATVTRTGPGTSPYISTPPGLALSAGTGNIDLAASTPGTYTVQTTWSGSCAPVVATTSVTVSAPPTLSATITPASCPDQNDGAIDLLVTGGNGTPTFDWTSDLPCAVDNQCPAPLLCIPGPFTCGRTNTVEDLAGLPVGTYTVTVTMGGCSVTEAFVVGSSSLDSDEDGLLDCADDCPLAVDGIPDFDENTCACELGFFATITDINGNDVITACTICPPGSFCADGLVAVECPAGRFQDLAGQIACFDCGAGTFSATTGATSCSDCPVGTFSDATGSVSCTPCAAGYASNTMAATSCSACPPGSFSANSGQVECDLCPVNTYNPLSAQIECLACPLGQNSAPGALECSEVVTCTTDLTIAWQTDNDPTQLSWELRTEGTNLLVQSGDGSGVPANADNYPSNTCLPDGTYYLVVTDSGGDGITGGGYTLRVTGGARIIDNTMDNQGIGGFTSGSNSQVAGGLGFSIPVSGDNLISTSCDKQDWIAGQFIVANANPAVSAEWVPNAPNNLQSATTGYVFWFYNPNGGYSFRRFRSHATSDGFPATGPTRACHTKLNNWAVANHIPVGEFLNVKIRSRVNGTNFNWGPACRFMLDPVRAACPLTNLMDTPGNQFFSCGVTKTWGGSNRVHAQPVSGAAQYQFRFYNANESINVTRTTSTYYVNLNWTPALPNGSYSVEVRAFKNGNWCTTSAPWGKVCQVNIVGSPAAMGGSQNMPLTGLNDDVALSIFPNPNNGEQLTVSLSAVEEGVNTISVDLFDLTGARVSSKMIAVQDGFVFQQMDVNTLSSGVYLMSITAGSQRYTERLVIQK